MPCSAATFGMPDGEAAMGEGGAHGAAAALREAELREAALRKSLVASEARLQAERKRARRDKKTVAQRAKQAERSNGKASARKRKKKREIERKRAVRKDDDQQRKQKTHTGDALHSGARKHRRLVDRGGGSRD